MSEKIYSVVLAGVGGQGILLASTVVARAALAAGWTAKTNEVHGMAQRGGSVVAQIRFGAEVFSPLVSAGEADALGALELAEAVRYAHYLRPGGWAVVSTQRIVPVTALSGKAVYPADLESQLPAIFPRAAVLDAPRVALAAGHIKAANMVVVGALARGLPLPEPAWRQALDQSVPEKFRAVNHAAFDAGWAAGAAGGTT